MLTIGLTGGIGSGKSVVAELFAKKSVSVIDADIIARDVTKKGEPALDLIIEEFGKGILLSDGELNRTKLRDIIFHNAMTRKWLEDCLHPLILQRIKDDIKNVQTPYCIVVIPLLMEVNDTSFIDRILVVDAPSSLRIERAAKRDGKSLLSIADIMQTQVAREERLRRADDVIVNDGTLLDLEPKVDRLHEMYLALSSRK